MNSCDIYRYMVMTIRENCAAVRYSDDGRRCDVSGAWGDVPTADDLRTLRRCNSAIYRGWLAGCNEPDKTTVEKLRRRAAYALKRAREIVAGWGKSPAGGHVEIDAQSAANAGALVLKCFDMSDVPRRVDFASFFGREG
jgi:hypothetical protein